MTPVALFVHSRPYHTRITAESLLANPEARQAQLHVFCDGARDRPGEARRVALVREYVRSIRGFREVVVHESLTNLGLAASIISGVSKILEEFPQIIVLEDDLQVSSGFLAYMQQALDKYGPVPQVLSISGHSLPIKYPASYPCDAAFGVRASSWGWATWRDRWQAIDWEVLDYSGFRRNLCARRRFNRGGSDMSRMLHRQMAGTVNSWAIRFCYHQFKHGMVDVFPVRSLVENIGWGEGAENCSDDVRAWKAEFWTDPPSEFRLPVKVELEPEIVRQFAAFNSIGARAVRTGRRWLNSCRRRLSSPSPQTWGAPPLKTVLVSNIPAPYREPVYEAVARQLAGRFTVLYCQPLEADRKWTFPQGDYPKVFLKGRSFTYNKIYAHHVHLNFGVWKALNALDPRIVVTNGYNPTHLLAYLWARLHGRSHVAMTDGWLKSEEHLSLLHRLIRKVVLRRTKAFIGASRRSLEMFQSYGANEAVCFTSQLCGNNEAFLAHPQGERPFDIMFSGQFIERKMPFFFCEVAKLLKERRGRVRALLIGDGPLRTETLARLDAAGVEYEYPGFLPQAELPARYASAKLFLFPTLQECWGVVVNEACAAGTPVITCDNTAVDGELVKNNQTGSVLPLDAKLWADEAVRILDDPSQWERLSQASQEDVSPYTYQAAAQGIIDALKSIT